MTTAVALAVHIFGAVAPVRQSYHHPICRTCMTGTAQHATVQGIPGVVSLAINGWGLFPLLVLSTVPHQA